MSEFMQEHKDKHAAVAEHELRIAKAKRRLRRAKRILKDMRKAGDNDFIIKEQAALVERVAAHLEGLMAEDVE